MSSELGATGAGRSVLTSCGALPGLPPHLERQSAEGLTQPEQMIPLHLDVQGYAASALARYGAPKGRACDVFQTPRAPGKDPSSRTLM